MSALAHPIMPAVDVVGVGGDHIFRPPLRTTPLETALSCGGNVTSAFTHICWLAREATNLVAIGLPSPLAIKMSRAVTIDIVSDIICPWCFVGRRRLAKAIKACGVVATIRWHPFFLDSSLPVEGTDKRSRYVAKFGEARVVAMLPAMARTGAAEGITFSFGGKTASTLRAHRLMSWV